MYTRDCDLMTCALDGRVELGGGLYVCSSSSLCRKIARTLDRQDLSDEIAGSLRPRVERGDTWSVTLHLHTSVSVEMDMLQLSTIEKLHDPGRLVEM